MSIKDKDRPLFPEAAVFVLVIFDDSVSPLNALLGIDIPGLSEKEIQRSVLGEKVLKKLVQS